MNNKLSITISCTTLFLILSLSSINLYAKDKNKQVAKKEYKCHVELLGGSDTLYFINTRKTSFTTIANSVKGRKSSVQFSNKKLPIHKVVECVSIYGEFTGDNSKLVDARTLR